MSYTNINKRNIKRFYSRFDGNLYFKPTMSSRTFQVVDGFSLEDLVDALRAGSIKLIWAKGPAMEVV